MWLALGATVWLLVKPRLHEAQPMLAASLHLLMVLPFVALARLFLVNDTSVLHVAAFGGEDLPLKYRFAATWAAREGPLLMWLGWIRWWLGCGAGTFRGSVGAPLTSTLGAFVSCTS